MPLALPSITLMLLFLGACKPVESPMTPLAYPTPRKDNIIDDYSGTEIADPYRWMEALDSGEVAQWVSASNAVTEAYLRQLPLRDHFKKRLTELWNYPRVGVPVIEAGRMFYARNTGLQRQAPVFMRAGLTTSPRLVIDPESHLRRWICVAFTVDALTRRDASCLWSQRRRSGLDDCEGTRCRIRQRFV